MEPATTAAAAPAAEPNATPAAAPATEPAAATAPERLTKQQRRDQLIARMRQGKTEREPPPEDKPADEPGDAEKPETDAKPPEDKPEDDKLPEAPKKPDEDHELKLATARRELKNARADLLELKPLADKGKALEEQLAKAKEDPNAALAALKTLLGRDFGELTQWFFENKDKITTQQKYAELPPDVREEIELARKEREGRAAAAKQQEEQAAFVQKHANYSKKILEHLELHEEEYPLSAAFGKQVADDVARWALSQKGSVDARARLQEHETALLQDFEASFSNAKLLKQLFAKKPELRAVLAPLVGAAEPKKSPAVASLQPNGQPRVQEGPDTLTNRSASADTSEPARPKSREERKREIREAFRRYKSA